MGERIVRALRTAPRLSRTLRSSIALSALLGSFLIPLAVTDLRGVTHVVTCEADAATPFTLIRDDQGSTISLSSLSIERSAPQSSGPSLRELCGGLTLDPGTRPTSTANVVTLVLPVTNHSSHTWAGSVAVQFDDVTIPVDIGNIAPATTATGEVTLRLRPGTHEVSGSILVGP